MNDQSLVIRPRPFSKLHRLLRVATACLILALAVWCVWPWLPFEGNKRLQTIVLYGFSILESVITESIFPIFQKKWRAQTGQEIEMIGSFAGSGTITNQLIMGVPAELAILSTELDAKRLVKAGTLHTETWKQLPHGGVINRTPFVIVVRPGNPKKIHDFSDLARPGIHIVHPDPLTSGAANWGHHRRIRVCHETARCRPRCRQIDAPQHLAKCSGSGEQCQATKTQFDNGFGDATDHLRARRPVEPFSWFLSL